MFVSRIYEGLVGEGSWIGMSAMFVVAGKCNLNCLHCDERAALDGLVKEKAVEDIVGLAQKSNCHNMVITGGEPSLYKGELEGLIDGFHDNYRRVLVETNGMEYMDIRPDLLAISPKLRTTQPDGRDVWPVDNINRYLDEGLIVEIRVAIGDELDFQEALIKLSQHHIAKSMIFLAPKSATLEEYADNAPWLASQCLKYGFRFSPRLKFTMPEFKED